jgi:hypothetical protein
LAPASSHAASRGLAFGSQPDSQGTLDRRPLERSSARRADQVDVGAVLDRRALAYSRPSGSVAPRFSARVWSVGSDSASRGKRLRFVSPRNDHLPIRCASKDPVVLQRTRRLDRRGSDGGLSGSLASDSIVTGGGHAFDALASPIAGSSGRAVSRNSMIHASRAVRGAATTPPSFRLQLCLTNRRSA